MLPQKSLSRGGAHAALMLNAGASPADAAPRAEVCLRCGLKRVPHSSIVIVCAEGRTVEAPLCGRCARRMSR
jgi:hypothetical protein